MKILIYGINFYPELTGIGKYSGELSDWLVENGSDIHVVTAPPYYPEWKIQTGYSPFCYKKEIINGATIYRCPLYVPKKLNKSKRLLHLGSFAMTSFFALLVQFRWKPDIIICVAPALFCVPGQIFISKLTKAKTILHIQDFEVDAMLGLGISRKGFFSSVALSFERWCFRSVNSVSSISHTMLSKVFKKETSVSKLIFFPNWAEIERFSNIDNNKTVELKKTLELPEVDKIILYSGNLGEKQGLEIIIETALLLKNYNFLFLIVGDGGQKNKLQTMVKNEGLTNILFRPLQSYDFLPNLLALADCHLVIQKKGAADSVLPSKLTNILAVGGNAVITAEPGTELGKLCIDYPGIATLIEPESMQALADGILLSLSLQKNNIVAKKYAEENLDKKKVIRRFFDEIKE